MGMTVKEASEKSGLSVSAIYAGIKNGTVRATKKGRSYIVLGFKKTKQGTKKISNKVLKKKMKKSTKVGLMAGGVAGSLSMASGLAMLSDMGLKPTPGNLAKIGIGAGVQAGIGYAGGKIVYKSMYGKNK